MITLRLELRRAFVGEQGIALPSSAGEVNCFVTGDAGLRLESAEAVALRLPSDGAVAAGEIRLRAHLVGERRYTVELYLDGSGSDSRSLREFSDTVSVAAPIAAFRPEILPPLDLRVAARPDVVLEVTATSANGSGGAHRLTYRLSSRVAGAQFAAALAGVVDVGPVERSRIRSLVRDAVRMSTAEQPEDSRARMVAIGTYLYDRFVPREGAGELREMIEQLETARRNRITTATKPERPLTWLIIENGTEASLPWELVVPYESNSPGAQFLSEWWQMSHWLVGLGPPLQSEVPVGDVALMYYGQSVDETDDARQLGAWGRLLNASMASDIKQVAAPETPVYGLHLLRQGRTGALGIAPRGAGPATDEVRRARLDLRLKRPLVTLGVLDGRSGDETNAMDASAVADGNWPLVERALPYLRAGASGVAGAWWQTSASSDRVFWTTFYDLLIARQNVVRREHLARSARGCAGAAGTVRLARVRAIREPAGAAVRPCGERGVHDAPMSMPTVLFVSGRSTSSRHRSARARHSGIRTGSSACRRTKKVRRRRRRSVLCLSRPDCRTPYPSRWPCDLSAERSMKQRALSRRSNRVSIC